MKNIVKITQHSQVSEKALERYLTSRSKASGLLCLKYSNSNEVGYPDRILVCPDCRVVWIEVKSADGRPSAVQKYRHEQLRKYGHEVYVVKSRADIDKMLNFVLDL